MYVELPAVGAQLKAGSTFGVVESVKVRSRTVGLSARAHALQAASDVYSPVSGTVLETNAKLSDSPALVNSAPFGDAWMMKVKLSAPAEAAALLDATAYGAHCEAGGH